MPAVKKMQLRRGNLGVFPKGEGTYTIRTSGDYTCICFGDKKNNFEKLASCCMDNVLSDSGFCARGISSHLMCVCSSADLRLLPFPANDACPCLGKHFAY